MHTLSSPNGNATASWDYWWICPRSTHSSQMTTSTATKTSAPSQTRHNTWQGKNFFVNSTAPKPSTAFKWQIKCQQNYLLLISPVERSPSPRTQQGSVSILDLHPRVPWLSHQSRPICAICRLYWDSRKNNGTAHQEHQVSFQMHQRSRTEAGNWKKSFWSDKGRISPKDNHPERSRPARPVCQKFSLQSSLPEIKKASPKIYRFCKLLSKLHTTTFKKKHIGM